MAYRSYSYGGGFGALGGGMTPWVKRLLIANAALYVVVILARFIPALGLLVSALALRPAQVLYTPWTLVTYAFLHAGIWHLLGNMLVLFFFGPRLEEHWGSREFIKVYLIAALAGGVASVLLLPFAPAGVIVGASGAALGLLVAYAMLWPDNEVHIWGIFPIKVKWLVAILVVANLAMAAEGARGIAVFAHLGGMAATFFYLRSPWGPKGWGNVYTAPKRSSPVRSAGTALVSWMGGKKGGAPSHPAGSAAPAAGSGTGRSRQAERELLEDVDRILDKISEHGIASLTEAERKRLDEVSRKRRTN
jgi:membrane associated rhomboid family serine protease